MKALIQRVSSAQVTVEGQVVGSIEQGLLALVGIEPHDTPVSVGKMLQRLLNYRVFSDADDKMNCSLTDVAGGLLLVSQFTLAANTKSGLRPSFSSAAPPALGAELFDLLVEQARSQHPTVATGQFGANMQVQLTNDGPVTFLLEI